jgi:hypothetical protein
MEEGINILTTGHNVKVDGAEELIEEWENGNITREELREKLMNLETIVIDLTQVVEPSKFKDSEE